MKEIDELKTKHFISEEELKYLMDLKLRTQIAKNNLEAAERIEREWRLKERKGTKYFLVGKTTSPEDANHNQQKCFEIWNTLDRELNNIINEIKNR